MASRWEVSGLSGVICSVSLAEGSTLEQLKLKKKTIICLHYSLCMDSPILNTFLFALQVVEDENFIFLMTKRLI